MGEKISYLCVCVCVFIFRPGNPHTRPPPSLQPNTCFAGNKGNFEDSEQPVHPSWTTIVKRSSANTRVRPETGTFSGTPVPWTGDSLCVVRAFWRDGEGMVVRLLTSPPACRMSQECDVLHMHSCPDVSKNFPACPFSPAPESLYLSCLFIFRCIVALVCFYPHLLQLVLFSYLSLLALSVNKHVGPNRHLTSVVQ